MRGSVKTSGYFPYAQRSPRSRGIGRRVLGPVAGQSFEIVVDRDSDDWIISVPEIGATARASHRTDVELAARKCIARHTGIPVGYILVWARD
jgi:hypothetical protein